MLWKNAYELTKALPIKMWTVYSRAASSSLLANEMLQPVGQGGGCPPERFLQRNRTFKNFSPKCVSLYPVPQATHPHMLLASALVMACRYRTQMCNDGIKCTRKICFFAHTPDELRQSSVKVMPPGEAAKAAAAAAAAVGMPANASFPEAFERQASSSGDTLAVNSDSALARFPHDSWEYESGQSGPLVMPGSAGSRYQAGVSGGGRIRHARGSVDTARAHRLQPFNTHDGPHSLQQRYSIDFGQLPHLQGPPTAPPGYLPPDVMGSGMLHTPSSGSDAASSQATAALAAALLHMQLAGNSTSGEDEPNSAPSNVQEALVQQHQAQMQQLLLQHALLQQQHEQQQQADAQNAQFLHLLSHPAMAPGINPSAAGGYGSEANRGSPPHSQLNLRAPHQMSQLSRDFMPAQAGMLVPHSEGELHGGSGAALMAPFESSSSGPSSRQLGGALGKIDESSASNSMHMHLHDL